MDSPNIPDHGIPVGTSCYPPQMYSTRTLTSRVTIRPQWRPEKQVYMFRWDVSAAAIDIRAEACGWPVTMVEVLEQATQKASLEYTQLQRKLKADTIKLQEDIQDCSKQVSAFASLNDVNEQVFSVQCLDLFCSSVESLRCKIEAVGGGAPVLSIAKHHICT